MADVGTAITLPNWYGARLAGLRVTAHVWISPDELSNLDSTRESRMIQQLKNAGIRAIFSDRPVSGSGWVRLDDLTTQFVRMIS